MLVGNVGKLFGGRRGVRGCPPRRRLLELGVVTADGLLEWARTLARTAVRLREARRSCRPRGRSVKVKLDRKVPYELDGGDRKPAKALHVEIEPAAITICVPADARGP